MATTKSSTTKNRRSTGKSGRTVARQVKAAEVRASSAKVKTSDGENRVVTKRLGRLPDKQRKAAAAAFMKGVPVAEIAEQYKLRLSNARYMVRQELVEQGKVKRLSPTDVKALRKAMDDPTYGDAAWVACRAGISGSKLSSLLS